MAYQEECLFALILSKMVSTINSQLAEMQNMLMQSNTGLAPLSNVASDITLSRRSLGLSSSHLALKKNPTLLGFNCVLVVALQKVMKRQVTGKVLHAQTRTPPFVSLGIRTSSLIFRSTKCSQFPAEGALFKALCIAACGGMALNNIQIRLNILVV